MLRLNPEGYLKFVQSERFEATYAGGEANVAVSLANFGNHVEYITKVPANEIGQCAINALRKFGVVTNKILRGGDRLGIYFVEKGASQRPSKVIYDRAGSAIALAKREEFNWNDILKNIEWFHFTGITPALGGDLPQICLDAIKKCRTKGITVSCDLNYRAKLWSREQASKVMNTLMPYVDVLIGNEEDAKDYFGIEASETDIEAGTLNHDGYISVAEQLNQRFGCKVIGITLRGSISASDNTWAGMLFINDRPYFSQEYLIRMVDRFGGGDSFGGGLIHALINDFEPQDAIEFAVASSCLKQTIEFDFNQVTVDDVLLLAGGNVSGRVQR